MRLTGPTPCRFLGRPPRQRRRPPQPLRPVLNGLQSIITMEIEKCLPRTGKILLLIAMTLATRAPADDQVRIDSGVVAGKGADAAGVRTFLGIPFAAPPVGNLRWREPQQVTPWEGVRQATTFGPRPMQGSIYSDMVFRDKGPSEDCLYLNVWTPAKGPAEKLPVMVWIFGGGFHAGSTSEARQDGGHLARKGVVVVSMNYRLGVFGFFSLPELSAESGHGSGNYGIMDQTAALRWVQRNIQAFGGDPGNVTIFGESAGSYSVSVQMATPTARGLFQKAIGESGSLVGTRRIPETVETLSQAEQNGTAFAKLMGAKSIAELRAKSSAQVYKAARDDTRLKDSVVVDGYVLPKDVYTIYAEGNQAHVPLLAGWNSDESRVYAVFGSKRPTAKSFSDSIRLEYAGLADAVLRLYPATTDADAVRSAGDLAGDRFIVASTWNWVEMQQKTGVPIYRYLFDRAVPIGPGRIINGAPATSADVGAPHAGEIPYVFGAFNANPGAPWEKVDHKLSDTMETYWSNFAKKGDPNGLGVPEWPLFLAKDNYPVMHLGVTVKAEPETHRPRHAFWDAAPTANPVINPGGTGG
jgi:para-nitrobenzyl esterase